MIIHHADCLHKGIADFWADKFEAPFSQFPAHGVRLRGGSWYFVDIFPKILYGLASDKRPDKFVEAAELVHSM